MNTSKDLMLRAVALNHVLSKTAAELGAQSKTTKVAAEDVVRPAVDALVACGALKQTRHGEFMSKLASDQGEAMGVISALCARLSKTAGDLADARAVIADHDASATGITVTSKTASEGHAATGSKLRPSEQALIDMFANGK